MTSESRPIARVLFVDDNRMIREIAQDGLADRVQLECCATAEEALDSLVRTAADLVISDLNMPGLSGIDLLERVRREHPGTDFVLLTANATVESAIEAVAQALCMKTEDFARAYRAYAAKRTPVFEGN